MAKCKKCGGRRHKATFYPIQFCERYDLQKCSHCRGTGIEPKDKKEVTDKEKGVFTKPTPAQCRKVAAVIRKGRK